MGLYIHIPFCGSICSYCHFARTAQHDRSDRERYVDGVLRELQLRRDECALLRDGARPLASAYLGGGTPSQLEPDLMRRLLAGTVDTFAHADDFEATAEANPESFSEELAAVWRDAGIGRVSLGIQSLREEVLALLGRACSPATARRALDLACRTFPRVSADWILGPRLETGSLLRELDEAIDLGVEHFSLYILEIHEGTALQREVRGGRVRLPSDEQTERTYLAAGEHLEVADDEGRDLPGTKALPGAGTGRARLLGKAALRERSRSRVLVRRAGCRAFARGRDRRSGRPRAPSGRNHPAVAHRPGRAVVPSAGRGAGSGCRPRARLVDPAPGPPGPDAPGIPAHRRDRGGPGGENPALSRRRQGVGTAFSK